MHIKNNNNILLFKKIKTYHILKKYAYKKFSISKYYKNILQFNGVFRKITLLL